jgi:hypothetical protein
MKIKTITVIFISFITVSVHADHSEIYKIEIKPAAVIDTITPLTIDVYTDFNSGSRYELRRKIFYPLTHKKFKMVKREGKSDSLIEIKSEFWCEYPEVHLPYEEYSKIKTKKVKYSYFKGQPLYSTVTEHIIIENDTTWVVAPDSSLSIMQDPFSNSNNKKKNSIETENKTSEKKEESIYKEKKQQSKSILQRIKDFLSR